MRKKNLWEVYRKPEWMMREWRDSEYKPPYVPCERGFCLYEQAVDAMLNAMDTADSIAMVEVGGQCFKRIREHYFLRLHRQSARQWWQKKRIIKLYTWTKRDSVELAIFVAKMVMGIFEKKFPKDKTTREAIRAAEQWLRNPSVKTKHAAKKAALAAMDNESEKLKFSWSIHKAKEAASSACSAAWSAANNNKEAAVGTGIAAIRHAIESASGNRMANKIAKKCEKWIQKRLKEKE